MCATRAGGMAPRTSTTSGTVNGGDGRGDASFVRPVFCVVLPRAIFTSFSRVNAEVSSEHSTYTALVHHSGANVTSECGSATLGK